MVDLTIGIWVEAVATVGLGTVEFMIVGTVGEGTGWAMTLT